MLSEQRGIDFFFRILGGRGRGKVGNSIFEMRRSCARGGGKVATRGISRWKFSLEEKGGEGVVSW